MKNHLASSLLFSCLLALVTVGCASSGGYKKADQTGSVITDFRDEIVSIRGAVETTLDSLDAIVAQADLDPRKSYDQFAKSVKNLDSSIDRARKQRDKMQQQGAAYFDAWSQSLTNMASPQIRKLAEERKEELKKSFDNVKVTLQSATTQFEQWFSNVKDLNTFLANDLTTAGINSARELVKKSRDNGTKLVAAIDEVIAELNAIAAAMTPARNPAQ